MIALVIIQNFMKYNKNLDKAGGFMISRENEEIIKFSEINYIVSALCNFSLIENPT